MRTTKTLIALAAAAALAAVPAAANAAYVRPTTTTTTTTTYQQPTYQKPSYTYLNGASTGEEGSASDELCQAWADYHDMLVDQAGTQYDQGNYQGAYDRYEKAANVVSYGEANGCYFYE